VLLIDTTNEHTGGMVLSADEFLETLPRYPLDRWRFIVRDVPSDSSLFNVLCWYTYQLESCVLAVDELAVWADPRQTPKYLDIVARMGRHREVDLMVATQRPMEVPNIIRSQCDRVWCFAMHEPNDLKWIQYVCGPEAPHQVRTLAPFEVGMWDMRKQGAFRTGRITLTSSVPALNWTVRPGHTADGAVPTGETIMA
jgi:hypothetical protein